MTSSTSIHSKAFDFMSFLEGGVDPRTGVYALAIKLPDVKTNDLRGPGFPLALTYSPLNIQDSGYGLGWNLQLSQYTPGNKLLSLSTGETFLVTGFDSETDQFLMKEKKLDTFHFYPHGDDLFRVVHKSGLVEILKVQGSTENRVALPIEIHSPEGHKVTLQYKPFGGSHWILEWIKDDSDQTLLTIDRASTSVKVSLYPYAGPDDGPLARFVMTLGGAVNYVTSITLPTENEASWRFNYLPQGRDDLYCIDRVETPTGGREEVFYQDNGHLFPDGSGRNPLPRVTRLLTSPGFGQPQVDVHYTYPGEKNFLGFGLTIQWADDGLDNLFKYIGDYEYQCVETLWVEKKAVRSIERKFNQFHLLTSETTIHNNSTQVKTVATTYNLSSNTPYEQQPNNCQLPTEVKTTWSIAGNATRQRSEPTKSTYDEYGNLLTKTDANGVLETNTWLPADDTDDFVRYIKDSTITPAPSPNGKAPTLRTRYTYKTLPPVDGSPLPYWTTLESETLVQVETSAETELQRTVYTHINQPSDAFQHGRVERQTLTLNGKDTISDYLYSKVYSPEIEESVLHTVETLTGWDHGQDGRNVTKEITLEHSVWSGEPLLNRDDNNVKIRYTYDSLRRVISETVSPGTSFEATRDYEYFLCANANDQAQQLMFDVKKVKTCTKFDGLNRAIYEERDDADNSARASEPRQTYAALYNELGQLTDETTYDWRGEQDVALTSHFEYDDWGEQRCVTGPDGVKTFEETDPIGSAGWEGPIQCSWREGKGPEPQISAVTETWIDLFEKPVRSERKDLGGKRVSLQQYFNDGLGRTVKEIVGFDAVQRETSFVLDAFGRMIENTLQDSAVVRRSYSEHSSEDLPTLISVNDDVLGTRVYDGIGRMFESVTGGRKQTFTFDPGHTQPKTVTTPSGQTIKYVYEPQLGTDPVLRSLPSIDVLGEFDDAEYEYDLKNARLLFCKEQGLQLFRDYYSTGELKSERRVVEDVEYTMQYQYSRLGLLLGYTDVLGHTQSYTYDLEGRLLETQLGTTLSTFTYDSLGRTATILTSDSLSGQSVGTTLEYDECDRETLRSFDLDGVKQTLRQEYNDVDGLTQRTLKEGTTVLRDETYKYDLRGRLINYTCTGSQPPVDPYGKPISSQIFTFDHLDNITLVLTNFGAEVNRARYFYENEDKVQLSKVTNNHADYPQLIALIYNKNGHLTQDEEERTLEYDANGRLIRVSGDGSPRSYHYSPLDEITGSEEGGSSSQRFYQGGDMANQIQGDNSSTFVRAGGVVLAEHQAGDGPKS